MLAEHASSFNAKWCIALLLMRHCLGAASGGRLSAMVCCFCSSVFFFFGSLPFPQSADLSMAAAVAFSCTRTSICAGRSGPSSLVLLHCSPARVRRRESEFLCSERENGTPTVPGTVVLVAPGLSCWSGSATQTILAPPNVWLPASAHPSSHPRTAAPAHWFLCVRIGRPGLC